ncbi:hypothetical protein KC330_g172 [Hortaea werneckii]|nr:hypothetical protein KC330_g172 [Hortaea werneckii]
MYIASNYIPSLGRMPRVAFNAPTTTLATTRVEQLSLYIFTQSRVSEIQLRDHTHLSTCALTRWKVDLNLSSLQLISRSPILQTIAPGAKSILVHVPPMPKLVTASRPGQISRPDCPGRWKSKGTGRAVQCEVMQELWRRSGRQVGVSVRSTYRPCWLQIGAVPVLTRTISLTLRIGNEAGAQFPTFLCVNGTVAFTSSGRLKNDSEVRKMASISSMLISVLVKEKNPEMRGMLRSAYFVAAAIFVISNSDLLECRCSVRSILAAQLSSNENVRSHVLRVVATEQNNRFSTLHPPAVKPTDDKAFSAASARPMDAYRCDCDLSRRRTGIPQTSRTCWLNPSLINTPASSTSSRACVKRTSHPTPPSCHESLSNYSLINLTDQHEIHESLFDLESKPDVHSGQLYVQKPKNARHSDERAVITAIPLLTLAVFPAFVLRVHGCSFPTTALTPDSPTFTSESKVPQALQIQAFV